MKERKLGRSGMSCSEVGLGTWAFASQIYGEVARDDALDTIAMALDRGVTLFDTAPLYGTKKEDGVSERILADGLGGRRGSVLISTKFGRYSTDGAAPNFHAQRARESVEGSLQRLGTDHIDVLFFHSPFGEEDIHDDVWEELDRLRIEGKVRAIGHSISMFEETEGMARQWADERRIDVIQVVYSLMNRQSSALIREMSEQGLAVFARESLANGFLTDGLSKDVEFGDRNINKRYSRDEISERVDYVEGLRFLVRRDVSTMAQAAVRWVLDHDDVSVVLSGAKNSGELDDWLAASDAGSFSTEEMAQAAEGHYRDFQAA